jgi:hypothetical protein
VDLATFRTQYPEFAKTSDPLVSTMLAAAASRMSQPYWGDQYDQGHGLLTASMLAIAPNGMTARLQSDKGMSTYAQAFDALRTEITFADRVF